MRVLALLLAVLSVAHADRVVAAHRVRVTVPTGWGRVSAASPGPVVDPQTVLVAGTVGVAPKRSQCQIAAYRIPPAGAVVVVVRWKGKPSGVKPGRAPLRELRKLTRPSFECFRGRGAAVEVVLGGRMYQVNVLVGDRAGPRRVEAALRVARSFDLVR